MEEKNSAKAKHQQHQEHSKKQARLSGADSLEKEQKALGNGRLPGILPGAESLGKTPIANQFARDFTPGKKTRGWPWQNPCLSPCLLTDAFAHFSDALLY